MRIATNAGGLFGFTMSVFDLEVDIDNLEKTVEETISALGSVRNATTQINGGVGTLRPALDALNARIRTEEEKLEGIRVVKRESIEFLDFMTNTDAEVAKRVRQNKNEFYQAYPHLKPPDPPKEKNFIEKGIDNLVGLYQDGKEFVVNAWNAGKELVIEGWNNLKDLATDAWNGLVEWYETSGAKEIVEIVFETGFMLYDAVNDAAVIAIGVTCLGIPGLTALGVGILALKIPATIMHAVDHSVAFTNDIVAFRKKQDANEAERNGELQKAEQLRAEANTIGEIESLKQIWWSDGELNGWDIAGYGLFALDIVDMAASFNLSHAVTISDDIAEIYKFQKSFEKTFKVVGAFSDVDDVTDVYGDSVEGTKVMLDALHIERSKFDDFITILKDSAILIQPMQPIVPIL